ncbi:nicotinate-nucleotide adenylyltransferase [Devosia enhydra]|uniref:Probable nicotinate-nucleotide adenylyltransferase n=2 Tax=Devosia enhydra TaxID=665118 RepID=A0A1K2I2Z5_9HYPH|nr:nicotinate-nucleotide adenylyltransferase [Devosia enhydra]SFZ86696.1 nicotinate-nucleotide adenylyltransferase [Devosia enhydra]
MRPPPAFPGMRIGLFGGSFDPFHEGHRLVAMEALKRLRLDTVWILVTPGNPLKDRSGLPPLAQRMADAHRVIDHPRIRVTGFEAARGFTYSYETVAWLRRRYPGVDFVWIMGGDSLRSFHRWQRWRDMARLVPIAVHARPGSVRIAPRSRAAQWLDDVRIPEDEAATLAGSTPPAWTYLTGVVSGQSSTAIRARRLALGGSSD